MSAAAPGSDRLGTLTAVLLLLPALPVAGLLSVPLLPASAAGYLALAVPLLCVLLIALALPAEGGRSPATRVLVALLAGLPFLVFGCVLAGGGARGVLLPGLGLLLALALSLGLSAASPRLRRGVAATLLGLWAVDVVLAQARLTILPDQLNPLREPSFAWTETPAPAREASVPRARGLKPGSFVRVADDPAPLGAHGPGPWFVVAEEGPAPRGAPILRVAGAGLDPEPQRVPRSAAGATSQDLYVFQGTGDLRHAFDLGGAEILLVAPEAWEADARAIARAQAVAAFARQGGLVVGLGEGEPWPPELARALGGAGSAPLPVSGGTNVPTALGLGGVLRARDRASALGSLGPWLDAPRPHTAFDGLLTPPEPPEAWTSVAPTTDERRPLGFLLLGFTVAVVLLEPGARRARAALAALALPALAAVAGVLALAPGRADLDAQAVVFDLGGPGGRRVEVLWLRAGERGYLGRVAFEGGGALRWVGGRHQDGALHLVPDESAWLVRHLEARGLDPADVEDRGAAWLLPWLSGPVEPARLRLGRAPLRGLRIEGLESPAASTLTLAPVR